MHRRNPHISRALFWVGLALLILSAYELFVRLDASWGWAKGYFLSHSEAGTPVGIVLKYIPYENLWKWGYMLLCALLGLWALCSRRTRRQCGFMLVPAAALTALGFTMRLSIFGDLIRTLKLLPLTAFTALCLLHVVSPLPQPKQQPRPNFAPQPLTPYQRRRRSDRRKAS